MISARHLVFLEVASQLSFSKAAQVLFMSQPAISKHIKALEKQYQTPLFERSSNTINLTEAGKLLLHYVSEARRIQNQLEFELSTINDSLRAKGQLRVGASTTVALYILPRILSAFHQKYPEVKINVLNRNTDAVVSALIDRTIDIGIVEARTKTSAIQYQPFMSDEVVAICSAKSPIAQKRTITVHDLLGLPVALREQGSGTLTALRTALSQHAIKLSDLKVGVRLAGTEALKNFLKEDNCLGFLPRRSLHKELRDGELVQIDITGLHILRQFFFIQPHGDDNNGLNKAFVRFARSVYNR